MNHGNPHRTGRPIRSSRRHQCAQDQPGVDRHLRRCSPSCLGVDNGGAWLVALVAVSMAIGAAFPGYGPFQLFYRRVLRQQGSSNARPRPDDPAPHRFAQALGAVFLAAGAVALFAGATTLGWVLAWIVVALALVNLLFGFCAGCFVFYHLRRFTGHGAAAT